MTLQWWLQGIYLFTTIFGVGVMLVDMLGILERAKRRAVYSRGCHDGPE
jgi:hypothetical protein